MEMTDVIVFDRMPVAVRRLVNNSLLAGMVDLKDRDSMFGTGLCTECHPVIPVASWSSGEKVLWSYLGSLAGQDTVNLLEVASYFRSSGYIIEILNAFEAVAGLEVTNADGR